MWPDKDNSSGLNLISYNILVYGMLIGHFCNYSYSYTNYCVIPNIKGWSLHIYPRLGCSRNPSKNPSISYTTSITIRNPLIFYLNMTWNVYSHQPITCVTMCAYLLSNILVLGVYVVIYHVKSNIGQYWWK